MILGLALLSAAGGLLAQDAGDWSMRMHRQLRERRLPIEDRDLERLIRSVEATALRFDVDPLMVLAVIDVESRFDSRAVSTAGALGLMQLQEETAREIAARLSLPWTSAAALFEPELNILLGTCYLKELLERFRDPALALAAFYAGPSRIAADNLLIGPASRAYVDRVRATMRELL